MADQPSPPADIEGVEKRLNDVPTAAEFGQAFVSAYLRPAFGTLPKSEIDLLVFSLLVDANAINPNGSIYRTARALNTTPAKVRSLIFQYQLRHISEEATDRAVLKTLASATYWKEREKLCFGVESPLVRAAIAGKMREHGVFADISLSGDILKVSPEQFGTVISVLMPDEMAAALIKQLKKQGVNEGQIRKAVKEYGKKAAEDFIKDEGKDALKDVMKEVGKFAGEHGPNLLEHAAQFVDVIGNLL